MPHKLAAFTIATLLIWFASSGILYAQGRGHRGGGPRVSPPAAAGRGASAGHIGRTARPGRVPAVVQVPRIPPVVTPGIGLPTSRFVRTAPKVVFQGPVIGPYGYGPYGYGPYGVFGGYSPYIWTDPIYTPPVTVVPSYMSPYADDTQLQLSNEVQRLRDQVNQLQQEQDLAALRQPEPAAPAVPETPPVPTTLVFKDGHRMIIQNYAIVGQTLWVLDERNSSKIALSDLDLERTRQINISEGTRFPVTGR